MKDQDNRGFKPSDIITNKQYRAIIILIFYFFLFLFLIISVRSSLNKENKDEKDNNEKYTVNSKIEGFAPIKQSNFNYKYTLNVDGVNYIYEGKKYNKNDDFSLTVGKEKKYYTVIDDFTFQKRNNENILTEKPYYYIDFFNPTIIEQILLKATPKENDIYKITNINLDKILGNKIGIDNKLENNIILQYTDDIVTRIDIDYTNYIKYNGVNVKKVFLTLEYSNFGMIEEFDIKN